MTYTLVATLEYWLWVGLHLAILVTGLVTLYRTATTTTGRAAAISSIVFGMTLAFVPAMLFSPLGESISDTLRDGNVWTPFNDYEYPRMISFFAILLAASPIGIGVAWGVRGLVSLLRHTPTQHHPVS